MDLDELYLKTKVERREISEKKLKRDLDSIQKEIGGNSDQELAVFPDGAFERLKNNGIWEQIFLFLTDAMDIESAYHTCSTFQFQQGLNEKRLKSLLPNVLRILMDKKFFQSKSLDHDRPERTAILTMRLVSRHVKRGVESEFFERPFTSENWHLNNAWLHDNYRLRCCKIRNLDQLEKTISTLAERGLDLCFISHLKISGNHTRGCRAERRTDFLDRILEFLKIYGHAVWGLEFSYFRSELEIQKQYVELRDIVCRLPNLKALCMAWDNYDLTNECEWELEDVRMELNCKPFPCIPTLKYVQFNWTMENSMVSEESSFIYTAHILRRNDQIKTLLIRDDYPLPSPHQFSILEREGGLADLNLERFEGPYYPLPNILNRAKWPLKVLYPQLFGLPSDRFKNSQLFPTLNRFGSTLEELILHDDIQKVKSGKKFCKAKLDLPHLKRLVLPGDLDDLTTRYWYDANNDNVTYVPISDLVGLKSLEKLRFLGFICKPESYFNAFPRLNLIQPGWRKLEYKRGHTFSPVGK